jgi:hypothetical protein
MESNNTRYNSELRSKKNKNTLKFASWFLLFIVILIFFIYVYSILFYR